MDDYVPGRGDTNTQEPEPSKPTNPEPTDGRGDGNGNSSRVVAFTAKLCISDSYPTHSSVLKFADVLVNEGLGYNAATGVFTCPLAGFYHFSTHISTYGRSEFMIQKNGNTVVSAYHTTLPNRLSQVASISSVIQLEQGDTVWVNLWGPSRNDIFASVDNDAVFVGFRLG